MSGVDRVPPHQLAVYARGGRLYVQASLPSRSGMQALAEVEVVDGGWDGLLGALERAETLARHEAAKKPNSRRFADASTLPRAAGCETFSEFVKHAVACVLVRVPDYVLVMRSVGDPQRGILYGTPRQEELPAGTSLGRLAEIARSVIEARDGW